MEFLRIENLDIKSKGRVTSLRISVNRITLTATDEVTETSHIISFAKILPVEGGVKLIILIIFI